MIRRPNLTPAGVPFVSDSSQTLSWFMPIATVRQLCSPSAVVTSDLDAVAAEMVCITATGIHEVADKTGWGVPNE